MKRAALAFTVILLGLLGGMLATGIATASRNASGVYSRTTGNPVTTGTSISSTTFNALTSDLATEMTDSLSRSGKGAMLAPLQLSNGTLGAPSLTFGSDGDSGLYRVGSNDVALVAGGVKFAEGTASTLTLPLATTATTTMTAASLVSTTSTNLPDGTLGQPGLLFSNDPDTGMYRIGANDAALGAGGVKAIEWTGSAVTVPLATTFSTTTAHTGVATFTAAAAFNGGLTMGTSGSAVTLSKRATTTIDVPVVAANTCFTDQTVTVTGAAVGAECVTGTPAALPDFLQATCWVSAADTVTLRICNGTAGTPADPGSAAYSVRVFNP